MKTLKEYSPSKFNALSDRTKRVVIAHDVLAQLQAKKFRPIRGMIVNIPGVDDEVFDSTSLQASVKDAARCDVCAKGAVICSLAARFNTVTGDDVDQMYYGEYDVKDELNTKKIFGDVWQEMEDQFEGLNWNRETPLATVMKNIIKHNGQFKTSEGKLIG